MEDGSQVEVPQIGTFKYGTETAGHFGGPQSLCGDFYREPDDVCRGVTMAPPMPDAGFSGLGGDYYGKSDKLFQEPDDMCIGPGSAMGSLGGIGMISSGGLDGKVPGHFAGGHLDGMYMPGGLDGGHFDSLYGGGISAAPQYSILETKIDQFTPEHAPPKVPGAPFRLEVTSINLPNTCMPHEIGNDCLKFLQDVVTASILKVRQKKYWLKANVFSEGRMSTLKARIYEKAEGGYVLELQRRAGDAVTFNHTYQKAQEFYSVHPMYSIGGEGKAFGEGTSMPVSLTPLPAPTLDGEETTESKINPLLDWAGLLEVPSLQAEAATALADLAKDKDVVGVLCCERAFQKMQPLLQSSEPAVAYPTASLLSQLAASGQAAKYFAGDKLLLRLVEKVCAKDTCTLVRTKLASAIKEAVGKSRDLLEQETEKALAKALAEAVKEIGRYPGDVHAQRSLQEACTVLAPRGNGAPVGS